MAKKPNALVCQPATGRHVWVDPFSDGDTCTCGRFYLTLGSVHQDVGVIAELTEREPEEEG